MCSGPTGAPWCLWRWIILLPLLPGETNDSKHNNHNFSEKKKKLIVGDLKLHQIVAVSGPHPHYWPELIPLPCLGPWSRTNRSSILTILCRQKSAVGGLMKIKAPFWAALLLIQHYVAMVMTSLTGELWGTKLQRPRTDTPTSKWVSEKPALMIKKTKKQWKTYKSISMYITEKIHSVNWINMQEFTHCAAIKIFHSNFYGFITPNQNKLARTVEESKNVPAASSFQTSLTCSSAADEQMRNTKVQRRRCNSTWKCK